MYHIPQKQVYTLQNNAESETNFFDALSCVSLDFILWENAASKIIYKMNI